MVHHLPVVGDFRLLANRSYFKPYRKYYHQRRKFEPYAHAGVGVTTVNPKADYNGETVKLRPLATALARAQLTGAALIPAVTAHFMIAPQTGYVRIDDFAEHTEEELTEA